MEIQGQLLPPTRKDAQGNNIFYCAYALETGFCRCGGAVFEAEKLTVKDDVYHKRCFNCHRCSRALDSLIVMVATDSNIYCKVGILRYYYPLL